NRVLDYLLLALIALAVGSSLPRALERAALGYLGIATVVALYALGGKAAPGVHIGGLVDLNQTAFFSRLRAPLAYWNALALFCVLAVPIAIRLAAEPPGERAARACARGAHRAPLGGPAAAPPGARARCGCGGRRPRDRRSHAGGVRHDRPRGLELRDGQVRARERPGAHPPDELRKPLGLVEG